MVGKSRFFGYGSQSREYGGDTYEFVLEDRGH